MLQHFQTGAPAACPRRRPHSKSRVKQSISLEDTFYTLSNAVSEAGKGGLRAVEVALDWIRAFLQQAKPQELIEILKITDQKALYDKLADLFDPHLAKHLEPLLEDRTGLAQAELVSKLVMQFLTQGFCCYEDDRYYSLGTPHPDRVSRMLYEKLQPYFESQEKEQRQKLKDSQSQILKDRIQQYHHAGSITRQQAPVKARWISGKHGLAKQSSNHIGRQPSQNAQTDHCVVCHVIPEDSAPPRRSSPFPTDPKPR
jgi:hypothetical protein